MEEEATAGGQDWWQVLAVELKQHIWSHLGVKEIIMATAVCLEWRNILLSDQHQPWAIIFQRFLSPRPPKTSPHKFSAHPRSDILVVLVRKNERMVRWILGAST